MDPQFVPKDSSLKQAISQSFGQAATYYDDYATFRKDIADRLIASLQPWRDIIPAGPIIELGCGTGFVTQGLADLYTNRQIEVTDLSPEMVSFCEQKFTDHNNLQFYVQDAEEPSYNEPHYALSISGFTGHWFGDAALTFGKWLELTKPGGLLLASFPGNESFPKWKKYCQELGLPFTGNSLPDVEEVVVKMSVGPSQVDYYEDTVTQTFDSARDFFKHLKRIGASTQKEGRSLTSQELSMLIDHWDASEEGDIEVRYHVIFLAVKKDL